ncbi:MAG: apolipoprotein N-acyltransferase [Candidatus Omnitrophica bacterium]|nr:apolipoprotein N-acyltransferase [Candidatus Omnitrophota bacterium]
MSRNLALIIFSAILLSLSFSSFSAGGGSAFGGNLDILAWFSFVPFFFALEGKNRRRSFTIAYIFGFLFFLMSMYWLIYVTAAGWILLSLYQALYFAVFGLVFYYFASAKSYFFLPSAWVLFEYIRAHLFGGIGWNLLGYSQYQNLPIIQIADITGVYGVSFLVMLMNIAVYRALKSKPIRKDLISHSVVSIFVVVVLFSASLVYGYYVIARGEGRQSPLKVSVIQGNIEQCFKWDQAYRQSIMDAYEKLSIRASLDKPDLIVWPETAVPGFLNGEEDLYLWVREVINTTKTPLLVGSPMLYKPDSDECLNSAVLFSGAKDVLGRYDKLHLVVYGEFIPLEKQLPFLRTIFPVSGNFIPGKEYTVFNLAYSNVVIASPKGAKQSHNGIASVATLPRNDSIKFSVLICFEDIFPDLVRRFVKRGAQVMINITNDAWFMKTAAAYQHASNSVFRAVENRIPFVRSANTGLSCFIDKTGRIYSRVSGRKRDLFVEGIKTAPIYADKNENFTFYTKYGDIFLIFCIILVLVYSFRIRRKMPLTS